MQKLFGIQNKINILIVIGQLPQKKLGDLLTWALRTNLVPNKFLIKPRNAQICCYVFTLPLGNSEKNKALGTGNSASTLVTTVATFYYFSNSPMEFRLLFSRCLANYTPFLVHPVSYLPVLTFFSTISTHEQ